MAGRIPERGTMLILGMGLVAIAALVLALAVDVAVLHLRHRSAQLTADAAARAAAQELDLASYYASVRLQLPLHPGSARRRVAAYLSAADAGAWQLTGLGVDGDTVTVGIERPVVVPFPIPGSGGRVTVHGSGSAQLRPTQ